MLTQNMLASTKYNTMQIQNNVRNLHKPDTKYVHKINIVYVYSNKSHLPISLNLQTIEK